MVCIIQPVFVLFVKRLNCHYVNTTTCAVQYRKRQASSPLEGKPAENAVEVAVMLDSP